MACEDEERPTVSVNVSLTVAMGVVPAEGESVKDAVTREVTDEMTKQRAVNLFEHASVGDIDEVDRW